MKLVYLQYFIYWEIGSGHFLPEELKILHVIIVTKFPLINVYSVLILNYKTALINTTIFIIKQA